jgi:mono/diheme cytochrome c family protein
MTYRGKHLFFGVAGFVLVGIVLLSWAKIRRESAQTETPPDPPAMVAAPATYSWIDRDHGVAAIPISRAMDIIAEKGLPWGVVPDVPAPTVATAASPEDAPVEIKPSRPAGPKLDPVRIQAGQEIFVKRCQGCHAEGTKYPPLANRYGTKVELEGGGQATFDEAYIRESITDPAVKIAATYKAMPKLTNLTDEDIQNLAVYVHSLTK